MNTFSNYVFLITPFIFCLTIGCNNQPNIVRIILPKKSQGVFFIKQDLSNGTTIVAENGEITLSIPKNGQLIIKNTDFLLKWHSTTVQYNDGTTIPYKTSGEFVPEGQIACWGLFSTSEEHYYFIGTLLEKKKLSDLAISKLGPFLLRQINEK